MLTLFAAAPRERAIQIPLQIGAQPFVLEATVFTPEGAGPFPLAIFNHGAIGKADPSPRWRPLEQARWFTERGFVVVVPMRRGNAHSTGAWAEGFGSCEHADYVAPALESAKDILATLDFMATQPFVDPSRVILVGHSAGGFASLAAASLRPSAFAAIFNFAGGRGSLGDDSGARHNCSPEALVTASRKLGSAKLPASFWLYSRNDRYFPPALAHRMFDAFHDGAANATFLELPDFERDGHAIFWRSDAMRLWITPVAQALRAILG